MLTLCSCIYHGSQTVLTLNRRVEVGLSHFRYSHTHRQPCINSQAETTPPHPLLGSHLQRPFISVVTVPPCVITGVILQVVGGKGHSVHLFPHIHLFRRTVLYCSNIYSLFSCLAVICHRTWWLSFSDSSPIHPPPHSSLQPVKNHSKKKCTALPTMTDRGDRSYPNCPAWVQEYMTPLKPCWATCLTVWLNTCQEGPHWQRKGQLQTTASVRVRRFNVSWQIKRSVQKGGGSRCF